MNIAQELCVGTSTLWLIVNAYVLVFAGLMMQLDAVGNRYGRKRLLLIGPALMGAHDCWERPRPTRPGAASSP